MKMHESITLERVTDLARESMYGPSPVHGICVACGESGSELLEPDAEQCKCEHCGELGVYGAEQLLIYMTAL